MSEKNNEQGELLSLIEKLVEIEKNDYRNAREITKKRNSLRSTLKEFLGERRKLPDDSEFYAGIKSQEARASYKTALSNIAEKYKVPEDTIQEAIESSRGSPVKRLRYGRIEEADIKKLRQLQFDFLTPKI